MVRRRGPFYYYSVAPRFTPGSPAQVPLETATRVVGEEQHGYDAAMHGVYGRPFAVDAATRGLKGIVEERVEMSDCWIVRDMITGDKFIRLFPRDKKRDVRVLERKAMRLRMRYNLEVEGVTVQG